MPRLYLDLDGVFADFDTAVKAHLDALPQELDDGEMWSLLKAIPRFYRKLPLMRRADSMWLSFARFKPIFLSGVPLPDGEMVYAPQDKCWWVAKHYGDHVPVITCLSRDKANFCRPGDVLLDDRDHYADLWRNKGGVFIHHDPKDIDRSIRLVRESMMEKAAA